MSKKLIIFIESNTSGTGKLFPRAAEKLGFCPLMLCSDPGRYSFLDRDRVDVIEVDTTNTDEILAVCHNFKNNLAGVATSSDHFVSAAAIVANEIGLPGPEPEAVTYAKDKFIQRNVLKEAGVAVPDYHSVSTTKQGVAIASQMQLPVVVKPPKGTGSIGVKLCRDTPELYHHIFELLKKTKNERGIPIPRRCLIEEWVQGPEFSVETFGTKVIGITAKHVSAPPNFIEIGHDYPAKISHRLERLLSDTAIRALNALNLNWGPAHTEIRVSGKGAVVIEVNSRLAGGFIPRLIELSQGIDMVENYVRSVCGKEPDFEPKFRKSASIRFLVNNRAGRFNGVQGVEEVKAIEGIREVVSYKEKGENIEVFGDFRDRLCHFIAVGNSPAEILGKLVQANEKLNIFIGNTNPLTEVNNGKHRPYRQNIVDRSQRDHLWKKCG